MHADHLSRTHLDRVTGGTTIKINLGDLLQQLVHGSRVASRLPGRDPLRAGRARLRPHQRAGPAAAGRRRRTEHRESNLDVRPA